MADNPTQREGSGSCALICLIVGINIINLDKTVYIANVGDSRGLLSMNEGGIIKVLTKDHKPSEEEERKRIESNGGYIYK